MLANIIHKVLFCKNKNEGMQEGQSSEVGLLRYSNLTAYSQYTTQSNQQWLEGGGSCIFVPELRNDISFLRFSLFPSLPTPQVPHRARDLGSCFWLVYWAISRISELACSRPRWVMKGLLILSSDMANANNPWCRPGTSLIRCSLQNAWSRAGLPAAPSQLTSIQSLFLFQTPTEQTLIQLLCYVPVGNSTEEAPRE